LRNVPVNKVKAFEEAFYMALDARHKNILENLRKGKLENDDLATLKSLAEEITNQVK
jgi:F-type H+/Na+-transporting ATPase subunit alpha